MNTIFLTNFEGERFAVVRDHVKAVRLLDVSSIAMASGVVVTCMESPKKLKTLLYDEEKRPGAPKEWFAFYVNDSGGEMMVRREIVESLESRKKGAVTVVGFSSMLFHLNGSVSTEQLGDLVDRLS
jgi:hypothetical protein